jgi:hypothetical protein
MTQSDPNLKNDLDGQKAFDMSEGPKPVDDLSKITKVLDAGLEQSRGKVTALAEGGKILLMIQDAPDELRRIADEMERIGVQEIKAFVAYAKPALKELSVKPNKDQDNKTGDEDVDNSTS